ncbi:hypothetical protein [Paracoccus sp. ME4]|uniref:hypothetical protein n=1 Tax=Paracoccus sp. ME4 TaxID=3138066 RepID=UPI00398AB74F
MNTKITYMYRDGSNFKTSHSLVLSGELDAARIAEAMAAGDASIGDEPQFIPGQIGLPDLQDEFVGPSMWVDGQDHPWHALIGIEPTSAAPSPAGPHGERLPTAAEFLDRLMTTEWDETHLPSCHPMMKLRELGYGDAQAGTLHEATNGDGTGLYYALGIPRLGVHVGRSPSDPDMFLVQHGTIPQVPDELQSDLDTLGYELVDGILVRDCTGAVSHGIDALRMMVEANHAARGIDGDSELIRPDQLDEAYIRNLIGLQAPAEPEAAPQL